MKPETITINSLPALAKTLTLLDEEWTRRRFPIAKLSYSPGISGWWGIGMAEAAGVLGELWMLAARHQGGVMQSGGRIAGITMPISAIVLAVLSENVYFTVKPGSPEIERTAS